MALEFIDNQPFAFQVGLGVPLRNEYQTCKKDEENCVMIADGDEVFLQFKQTPCDSPLLCDSDFSDGQIGNYVTNGDFDGSASGWTLDADWSYNAAEYVDVQSTVSAVEDLSQTIVDGLETGECYVLAFQILNYVSGSLAPSLGGTAGTTVNADGEYRQLIVAGATDVLNFRASSVCELSIDNIQVYRLGFCWCADNGNLAVGDHDMCHIPGADTVLTQVGVVPAITSGQRYKVEVTISNRTAGFIHLLLGTAASDDFIGNGTFSDYVIADATGQFSIFMDSDFDGCITDVLVYEMATDIDVGVVETDGSFVMELGAYATFIDDRIILNFDTTAFSFAKGCYRLFILDPCDPSPDTYNSNCFSWKTTHPGTRQIIAIDRASADPNSRYSFGFLWFVTSFYLIQRVRVHFRRPVKETNFNMDRFSTGSHFKSYVEQSKQWEMVIETLDETQHDCMAVMLHCKSCSIDGVDYVTRDEEYSPLWDEEGFNVTADVRINVSRKQDVIFADNCNR